MPLYKTKPVHAASERQYTAAAGEVKVPWGVIYEWWKAERQEMDKQIGEANAVLRELYRSVDKTGAFKHCKAVSFISVFVPILTYGYGHESWVMTKIILTQVQAPKIGKDGSPRCDKGAYRV